VDLGGGPASFAPASTTSASSALVYATPLPVRYRLSTVVLMTLASRVRDAFDEWSTTHTGYLLDSAIASYYTPRGSPEGVIVVLDLDERHSVRPSEVKELRNRMARIARGAGIEFVSITVRTLDGGIVVTETGWVRPAEPAD